jgi:hypothetical protein
MKRLLLLAGAVALCTLALFAIHCTQVDFDNPLDGKEKGKNTTPDSSWLWNIDEDVCNTAVGSVWVGSYPSCGAYVLNNIKNPAIDESVRRSWGTKLGACVGDTLRIKLAENTPTAVTLYYDGAGYDRHPIPDSTTAGFQKWMGVNKQWNGVIEYTPYAEVRAILTTKGTEDTEVPPYEGNMPPLGEGGSDKTYVILYIAEKLKCGSETEYLPKATETRHVTIKRYTRDDTDPPVITFECQTDYTVTAGQTLTFNDAGCVSVNKGSTLTRTPPRETPIDLSQPGDYNVTYRACKTLIVGGNTKDSCVTTTKTIKVTLRQPTNLPTPVIVLNNYTYTLPDGTFSSPFGLLSSGAQYEEKGVERVFYLDENGAEVPIDRSRVILPPAPVVIQAGDFDKGDGTSLNYRLEASSGEYLGTTAERRVYRMDATCATSAAPRFVFRKPSGTNWADVPSGEDPTLTIQANKPWTTIKRSVRMGGIPVTNETEPANAISYSLGVDFGTPKLDLYNPKPNTYKVTYIAVSPCPVGGEKFFRSAERTITVSP